MKPIRLARAPQTKQTDNQTTSRPFCSLADSKVLVCAKVSQCSLAFAVTRKRARRMNNLAIHSAGG